MIYKEFIESIPKGRVLEHKEVHHILPRCLGGGNDDSNLIYLTPREHFIAHKLLALENPLNDKLVYAFHLMSTDGRREVTSEEYEIAKTMKSNSMKGKTLHNKPHTEETRRKISERTKEALSRPEIHAKLVESHMHMSEEQRRAISEKQRGRKHSEETKRKMSQAHKGKTYSKMSDEARENMSKSRRGKIYSYNLTCRVCGKKFVGNNPGIRRCPECKGEEIYNDR